MKDPHCRAKGRVIIWSASNGVHEEPTQTRTMKMPISRSVYVSPALAGERRTVRHSIGALRQLEVETSKAIGANRGGRH
ncbi:hypothetical protein NXC24_CH02447 [Rhizobium sp. NXC24]|nr:hypothetical protein NXC24_CH02447 [Rhizobium sp. NXC24]